MQLKVRMRNGSRGGVEEPNKIDAILKAKQVNGEPIKMGLIHSGLD